MQTRAMSAREQPFGSSSTSEARNSQDSKISAAGSGAGTTALIATPRPENVPASSATAIDQPSEQTPISSTVDGECTVRTSNGDGSQQTTTIGNGDENLPAVRNRQDSEKSTSETDDITSRTELSQAISVPGSLPESQHVTGPGCSPVTAGSEGADLLPECSKNQNLPLSLSASAADMEPCFFQSPIAKVRADREAAHTLHNSGADKKPINQDEALETQLGGTSLFPVATERCLDTSIAGNSSSASEKPAQISLITTTHREAEKTPFAMSFDQTSVVRQEVEMCQDLVIENTTSTNSCGVPMVDQSPPSECQAETTSEDPTSIADATKGREGYHGSHSTDGLSDSVEVSNGVTQSETLALTPQSVLDSMRQNDWPVEGLGSIREHGGSLEVFIKWIPVILTKEEARNEFWSPGNHSVLENGNVRVEWPGCWESHWRVDSTADLDTVVNAIRRRKTAESAVEVCLQELREYGRRFRSRRELAAYDHSDWQKLIKVVRSKAGDDAARGLQNSFVCMGKAKTELRKKADELSKLIRAYNLKPLGDGADYMEID